ncbi:MAG: hypothetical protein AAFX06_07465 [Planctomycetota bacterium]
METPSYLQSPDPEVWSTDLGGQAFQWGDWESELATRTIGFFPEVDTLLTTLADEFDGLPDFSSLLFLFAASVDRAPASALASRVISLKPIVTSASVVSSSVPSELDDPASHSRLRALFSMVKQLCGERDGVDLARVLIDVFHEEVFDNIALFPKSSTEEAFRFLRTHPVDRPVSASAEDLLAPHSTLITGSESLGGFARCWNFLADLCRKKIDVSSARLKLKTGVESVPSPAEIDDVNDERFEGLIRRLEVDDELGEVSAAARYVASVASLPLAPSDPSELPIGGVSDITNRGSPERLLMTELAADPLLLIARIATGKALYLRRETPPTQASLARSILIESSVRTWGQTRIRALAVALGLAASEQSRRDAPVEVFTVGDQVYREHFSSKSGLVASLERLSGVPHPGQTLQQWFDQHSSEQESPVLVISARTWNDKAFQSLVRKLEQEMLLVTIDHRGDIRILRHDRMGETELRRLRVEELKLGEPKRPSRSISPEDYPAFVRLARCPLRFSNNSSPTWCAASGTAGLWVRTPDKRLLFYDREHKGGLLVLERFAFKRLEAYRVLGSVLELVVRLNHEHVYVRIDAYDGVSARVSLPVAANEFFFDLESLYARDANRLYLLDKVTGGVIDSPASPSDDRVQSTPFQLVALESSGTHDILSIAQQSGDQVRWNRFMVEKGVFDSNRSSRPIGFRGPNHEPVLISSGLDVMQRFGDNESIKPVSLGYASGLRELKLVRVASDSSKVIVQGTFGSKSQPETDRIGIDLINGKTFRASSGAGLNDLIRMNEPALNYYRQVEVMARFTGIQVGKKGLMLFRRKSRDPVVILARDPIGFQAVVELTKYDRANTVFGDKFYVPTEGTESRRYVGSPQNEWGLRQVTRGDATLWLDSRGLLHLGLRDDPRQLTFVIQGQATLLGGWFSDSGVFGAAYYHERPDDLTPPPAVFAWYERWLAAAREA